MSDDLGTTTFLTVITTVTKTPGPVTVKTTLTILVQASGTATQSFILGPTETPIEPIEATTSTIRGVVTITATRTSEPASTSLAATPTSQPASTSLAATPTLSGSVVPNAGVSQTTVIILAVVLPLIAILAVAIVWRVRKARSRQQRSPQNNPGNPLQHWSAKVSKLWSGENKSDDDLPWQMPDGEREETKDSNPQSTQTSPVLQRSPLQTITSHPSRSSRPASIVRPVRDVMQAGSSGSYTHGVDDILPVPTSSRGFGGISPPRPGLPMGTPPQTYDGTRRAFYETALNRNLPFDRLARPSLRLNPHQAPALDPDRSLTPEPLRIVKSADSAGTDSNLPDERDGVVRRAFTEPLDARGYMEQAARSIEQALMDELGSIDEGPFDEEARTRQREATLSYLEGVLPMSPPTSYRASSVYSRNEWGSPMLSQEGSSLAPTSRDEIARTDERESKGKGKEADGPGDGSTWI